MEENKIVIYQTEDGLTQIDALAGLLERMQ
jgi:hypothetical protein